MTAFLGSVSLLHTCIDKVVNDRCRIFWGCKISLTIFWRTQRKTQVFQKANLTLLHFSGPKSHVWHPNSRYGKKRTRKLDSVWCKVCWCFSKISRLKNFWKGRMFDKKMHYLMLSAFSVPQSDACYFTTEPYSTACTAVGSVSSFDYERSCPSEIRPKNVKKIGSLKTCQLFRQLFSGFTDDEIKFGFVRHTGLAGQVV